jgi:hypothetical protein
MSQMPSRLNPGLVVRKEDVPETVQPPTAPPPVARVSMTYRPRQDVHEYLRAVAYNQRSSVQALIDEAVDRWIAIDKERKR